MDRCKSFQYGSRRILAKSYLSTLLFSAVISHTNTMSPISFLKASHLAERVVRGVSVESMGLAGSIRHMCFRYLEDGNSKEHDPSHWFMQ